MSLLLFVQLLNPVRFRRLTMTFFLFFFPSLSDDLSKVTKHSRGVTEKKEEGDTNSNLGNSCRNGSYSTKCTFCGMRRALLFNYISYASSVNPDSDLALPSLLFSPIPRKYQGFFSYSFQTTNQIDRFPSPIDSIPISPFIITPFPFSYGEKGESRPWKRRNIRKNENGEFHLSFLACSCV